MGNRLIPLLNDLAPKHSHYLLYLVIIFKNKFFYSLIFSNSVLHEPAPNVCK